MLIFYCSVVEDGEAAVKSLAKTMLAELKKKQAFYFKDKLVLVHSFFDPAKVYAFYDDVKWRKLAKKIPSELIKFFSLIYFLWSFTI